MHKTYSKNIYYFQNVGQLCIRFLFLGFLSIFAQAETNNFQYEVLEKVTHNSNTFTQGLVIHDGWIFESSGHYGKSFLQKLNVKTNEIEKHLDLPSDVFAEGITVANDLLYLLSWKAGKAWVIHPDSFELVNTFNYDGEGWGLTNTSKYLIISDGSQIIRFFDPSSFELKKTLTVKENGTLVKSLNELEYVEGIIWANIWRQNRIVGIDIISGEVIGSLDLSELQTQSGANNIDSVLNGIAYDKNKDAFWITGKYWTDRYLIKIFPQNDTE